MRLFFMPGMVMIMIVGMVVIMLMFVFVISFHRKNLLSVFLKPWFYAYSV